MYLAISISSCRNKHNKTKKKIFLTCGIICFDTKICENIHPCIYLWVGNVCFCSALPTGNLVLIVCVRTTPRHNTNHVKNDGVVSACYLHCDG